MGEAPSRIGHQIALGLVAAVAASLLVLNATGEPEDSTLVHLFEAVSILAGDRPHVDFFEWGAPLPAYLSAGAQLLFGYRLIGELVVQWLFIVAGVVLAFHLGLVLSRSVAATLVMLPLTAQVLAMTPTYHYSKLFCFPLAIWLGWLYMDHPTARRSAALGFTTAVAFLFRHDYGIWVGLSSSLALLLARIGAPESRQPGRLVKDCAAYLVMAGVTVAPWAIAVQASEGLAAYTRASAGKYEGANHPYRELWTMNPIRQLLPSAAPEPEAGIVAFLWTDNVSESQQKQLERQFGLRATDQPDSSGRLQFEVSNLYDVELLKLDPYIRDGNGFPWETLTEMRFKLPSLDNVALWLEQVGLLIPILLVLSGGLTAWRSWHRSSPVPLDCLRLILAGSALAVVHEALFREASYVVTTAPLTAALSARFLTGSVAREPVELTHEGIPTRALLEWTRRGFAIVLLLLTIFAAYVRTRGLSLFQRPLSESLELALDSLDELRQSPPTSRNWGYAYLRECTSPDDRLLVTGLTPFYVNYYTQRAMAGGHLYWRSAWRSDAESEAVSLALLQRQSVPFVVSGSDPVLADFERYPKILDYLLRNYVELEGMKGMVLVDKRRKTVRDYGPEGLPCFADGP